MRSRQTTVILGGSNGTKTLISILGDKSDPVNDGHVIRVVSRSPQSFLDAKSTPLNWTCNEQKAFSNLAPFEFLPKNWSAHVGRPDSVFGYNELGAALSGVGAPDEGGAADVCLLCCPVHAHLKILREVAKTLYELNVKGMLNSEKPLLIGTLYAAGGFDWMCKTAFCVERPVGFKRWSRPLALFGLRSFPYLCKSVEAGKITLYGRFPQLQTAVCPSTPSTRYSVRTLLGRVLQCAQTKIHIEFVGISSAKSNGGDGSGQIADAAFSHFLSAGKARGLPPSCVSIADLADPHCTLGFLGCTLNSTNQLLHPTIISDLFKTGSISWPDDGSRTPLPRFYADGATLEVGRLITEIGAVECYPVIHTLDALLAPYGMQPISYCHGGEPVGRFFLNAAGNSPQDLARRSRITDYVTIKQYSLNADTKICRPKFNLRPLFEFMLYFGLSRNARLGSVLSPAYRDPNDPTKIKPNAQTRFFLDDIPHGLCIVLGIAELLGLDLVEHMPETLKVVRKLQSWMGKQYVLPDNIPNLRVVADAKDLRETSAPQAFGVHSIDDFRAFLRISPFGVDNQVFMENKVRCSPLFSQDGSILKSAVEE